MTANIVIKEASIMGPTATLSGTTYQNGVTGSKVISMGGLRGVMRVATSEASSQSITLPVVSFPGNSGAETTKVPLQGKFVRIMNESTLYRLDFAFGVGAAPSITYGQTSAFGTGSAAAGWRLPPETWIDVLVPPDATHIGHRQETGAVASTLALYCSEGDTQGK